ncbi:MAG: orotidine-5'-phosphate decarboxylase [Chitinophagales bacterium]
MNREALITLIRRKKSMLCVGLDTDPNKIPDVLKSDPDPVFSFNKAIIDATLDVAVAYKPNIAFYEALGLAGWQSLERTMAYLNERRSQAFLIADAKRGDIGNTAQMYARAFFQQLPFDAITVAPYMGVDSIKPFLTFKEKWAIVLALTSNEGATNFQMLRTANGLLFEQVINQSVSWGSTENMMFVAGATRPEGLRQIRMLVPEHFLLVPGAGAQGGDIASICHAAATSWGGLLINSSRQIIYASNGADFAEKAREAAIQAQAQMCFPD